MRWEKPFSLIFSLGPVGVSRSPTSSSPSQGYMRWQIQPPCPYLVCIASILSAVFSLPVLCLFYIWQQILSVVFNGGKSMSTQSSQKEKYCIAFWNDTVLEIMDRLACKGVRDQVRSGRKDMKVKVAQLCLTLCEPMDYSVYGILQPRILEWVAFPSSRGSSQPRDWTQVSRIAGGLFTSRATREVQEYWNG